MIDNKHIVTWDTLQNHARTIARRLLDSKKKWERIIAVSRGGLVPGALLARELAIRYVDTVCISSYDYNIQRKKIDIIKRADGDGDRYIIVDDLVDTGNTAKAIRTLYPKAHFVTLFAKPSGRLFVDDYVVDIPQNTWIEQPWDMGFTFIPPLIRE